MCYSRSMMSKTAKALTIKSRGILVNLAVLTIAITLALLLSEMALRLIGRGPLYVSPERDRFWKYDSLLGWAHQPGQEGIFETPQFQTSVRINQKGLRDREHSYERTNDTKRILVIGDSFAWGYGVEETERFSQLLETSLGVEVINAGVSGYSTDQELLWLRTEGIKYDFDLVILGFTGNDIDDNNRQLVSSIYYKPQFASDDGQLILKDYPVPTTSAQGKFVYWLSQRSALTYFLLQSYFDVLSIYGKIKANPDNAIPSGHHAGSAKEVFGLTIALLDEIRSIAESKNANFMIVATPRWWNSPSKLTYQDFIDTLQMAGFPVLDVEAMAGFVPGEMLIPNDGHWNRAGHAFVAGKIKDLIDNKQLLNRPQNQDSPNDAPGPDFGAPYSTPVVAGVGEQ
jgi:LysM repeat protein